LFTQGDWVGWRQAGRSTRTHRKQVLVPDFNPIEKAFTRLKARRRAGKRTVSGLCSLIGRLVDLFQPQECATTSTLPVMIQTDQYSL
jgi:hypothetical protein